MIETVGVNVFATIFLFGILIFIHEWGHFIMCRLVGVRVEKFSLGFGKKIWSFSRNHTEYMISWIPLGGYVKMAGEEPKDDERPKEWEYYGKSPRQKAWILSGGVLMNVVLAIVIYCVMFLAVGKTIYTTQFDEVLPDYPAHQAGLVAKDKIIAINGENITLWDEMVAIVHAHPGEVLDVTVERDGNVFHVTIVPQDEVIKNIFGEDEHVGKLGVASPGIITEELGPVEAVREALYHTGFLIKTMYQVIWKLVTGQMSPKGLGGPILISKMAGDSARMGMIYFFNLVAALSINLAVLNFLPIPILDGGHMFFVLIEAIRKRPVSAKIQENAQKVGFAILMLLMVLVFYNDIERVFIKPAAENTAEQLEDKEP